MILPRCRGEWWQSGLDDDVTHMMTHTIYDEAFT